MDEGATAADARAALIEAQAEDAIVAEAPAMLAALRWAREAMTPPNNSEEIELCSEIESILARIAGEG
jgi:hypothetical protein